MSRSGALLLGLLLLPGCAAATWLACHTALRVVLGSDGVCTVDVEIRPTPTPQEAPESRGPLLPTGTGMVAGRLAGIVLGSTDAAWAAAHDGCGKYELG